MPAKPSIASPTWLRPRRLRTTIDPPPCSRGSRIVPFSTTERLLLGASQAEYRKQEGREEDLDPDDHERRREDRRPLVRQAPAATCQPPDHDCCAEADAGKRDA